MAVGEEVLVGESAFDERSAKELLGDETLDGPRGVASLSALPHARIVVDALARERVDTLREDEDETRTDNDLAFSTESTVKKRLVLTPEMRAEMPTLLDETLAFDTEPTQKRDPVSEETLSIEVDVQFTATETTAPIGVTLPTSQRMVAAPPPPVHLQTQTAPLPTPVPPSHVRSRAASLPISKAPAANDVAMTVADSGIRPALRNPNRFVDQNSDTAVTAPAPAPRRRGLSVVCFLLGAVTAFAIVVALRYPEARALLHMLTSR